MRVLFVCGRNRRRSPTAEAIFSDLDGIEVTSAGTSPEAECPLSGDLLEWADVVFVINRKQQRQVRARYAGLLKNRRLVCLGIPDQYQFMQHELQQELRMKVLPLLRRKT